MDNKEKNNKSADDIPNFSSEQERDDHLQMLADQKRIEEYVTRRQTLYRRKQQKRRLRKNRLCALFGLIFIVVAVIGFSKIKPSVDTSDSSSVNIVNKTETVSTADMAGKTTKIPETETKHNLEQKDGMTFVDGILIVNKTYSLPSDYSPGVSSVALEAFNKMAQAAQGDNITLFINSSYRSYEDQQYLYDSYVNERGTDNTDKVSSRPGHSEHQTGLAFDVNTTELSFEGTPEALWLDKHCDEYGFIIRFPKGKEDKTGYAYEPWHIRYVGIDNAKAIKESGLCLEEYLGVSSDYKYADDSQQDISQQ